MRIKAAQNHPIYQTVVREQRWDAIPGAESHADLTARITRALGRIAANHPDELVVAVVHGGVIANILAHATGALDNPLTAFSVHGVVRARGSDPGPAPPGPGCASGRVNLADSVRAAPKRPYQLALVGLYAGLGLVLAWNP